MKQAEALHGDSFECSAFQNPPQSAAGNINITDGASEVKHLIMSSAKPFWIAQN